MIHSNTRRASIMQKLSLIPVLLFITMPSSAQDKKKFEPNYDEAKVPSYTLPDPLVLADATRLQSPVQWENRRRPEILNLFEEHVFGKTPAGRPKEMTFEVKSIDKKALGGKAIRKEVAIYFTGKKDGPKIDLLIYLPAAAKGKVPVFV